MRRIDTESLFFTPEETLERLETVGDLFKPVLTQVQKLPAEVRRYFEQQRSSKRAPVLDTYEAKRDFKKTAEPKPSVRGRSRQGSRRRFVIQKHDASHLHYDFRLEMHDVLKSWSVPKGPPFKKDERRLLIVDTNERATPEIRERPLTECSDCPSARRCDGGRIFQRE